VISLSVETIDKGTGYSAKFGGVFFQVKTEVYGNYVHLMAFSKCCVDGDGVGKDTLFYYKKFYFILRNFKDVLFFYTSEKNFFFIILIL